MKRDVGEQKKKQGHTEPDDTVESLAAKEKMEKRQGVIRSNEKVKVWLDDTEPKNAQDNIQNSPGQSSTLQSPFSSSKSRQSNNDDDVSLGIEESYTLTPFAQQVSEWNMRLQYLKKLPLSQEFSVQNKLSVLQALQQDAEKLEQQSFASDERDAEDLEMFSDFNEELEEHITLLEQQEQLPKESKKFKKDDLSRDANRGNEIQAISGHDLIEQFQPGDLIYGTTHARRVYGEQLKENFDLTSTYLWADDYNIPALDDFIDLLGVVEGDIQQRKENLKEMQQQAQQEKIKELEETLAEFEDLLKNRDKIITKFELLYPQEPKKHEHIRALLTDEKYTPLRSANVAQSKGRTRDDQIILRACKAKIQDPAIRKIHFCLDELNLGNVLNKEQKNTRYGYYSLVSAELRFICRYWDNLKTKVHFYQDGKQVKAPWFTNADLWREYRQKQLKKKGLVDFDMRDAEAEQLPPQIQMAESSPHTPQKQPTGILKIEKVGAKRQLVLDKDNVSQEISNQQQAKRRKEGTTLEPEPLEDIQIQDADSQKKQEPEGKENVSAEQKPPPLTRIAFLSLLPRHLKLIKHGYRLLRCKQRKSYQVQANLHPYS